MMAITLVQALLIGLVYFAANTSFLAGLGYFTTWRPVVNGLLVGVILGDPVRGATVGALINVLYLGYMSVGGTLGIGDAALASILGATVGVTVSIASPTQAIGIGVLTGVLAGNLGFSLLSLRMKLDNRIVHRMDLAAERGDANAIVWLNIIPAQALLLVITTLPAAVLGLALPSIVNFLITLAPLVVLKGLGLAGTGLAGALGIALAMKFVFKGRGVIVFLIGYAFIAVTEINIAIFVIAAIVLLLASDLVKLGRQTSGLGWNRATGAFLLWQFFSHSSYSFERLQGSGVASAFAPALRRLYPVMADRVAALKRHLAFFNVEPNWGSVVIGATLKMEEQHAAGVIDAETVIATKQVLMGTVSGFGDTVSQGAILPLLLSTGLSISLSTPASAWPAMGVVTYLALICPVMLAISAACFNAGYAQGRDAVVAILGNPRLKWWVAIAELVCAFMLGVLAAMQNVTGLHLNTAMLSQPLVDIPLRLGVVMLFYLLVQRLHIKPTIVLAGAVIAGVFIAISGAL